MSLELGTPISGSADSSVLQRNQVSSFPGNSAQEAWRFSNLCQQAHFTHKMLIKIAAVILRLLGLIHEALVEDIVVTKRYTHCSGRRIYSLSIGQRAVLSGSCAIL